MCLYTEVPGGRDPLRIKVCIGPWGLNVVGPKDSLCFRFAYLNLTAA